MLDSEMENQPVRSRNGSTREVGRLPSYDFRATQCPTGREPTVLLGTSSHQYRLWLRPLGRKLRPLGAAAEANRRQASRSSRLSRHALGELVSGCVGLCFQISTEHTTLYRTGAWL